MRNTCKICESEINFIFIAKVLNKYEISYYECKYCGFIQTEDAYWLKEAYSNAITSLDIGLVSRNINLSNIVEKMMINHWDYKKKCIDYGGGYGLFVRIMRDKGFDFYRQDIYCENLFAKYFDISDIIDVKKFEVLTAFELFEHLENPLKEIEKMFEISDSIIFSTELIPKYQIKSPDEWWYFAPETGQHISFYSYKSLETIAKYYNCYLFSNKCNLHVLTKKKISTDIFNTKDRTSTYNKVLLFIYNRIMNKVVINKFLPSRLESDYKKIKSSIHKQ